MSIDSTRFDFGAQVKAKSTKELLEIYRNAAAYNPAFERLVEKELVERGVHIDDMRKERAERLAVETERLKAGKHGSPMVLFFGFIMALLGGLLGVIIGYMYSCSKITSPAGEKIYVYDAETREWGNIIMWLGAGMLAVSFLWTVL